MDRISLPIIADILYIKQGLIELHAQILVLNLIGLAYSNSFNAIIHDCPILRQYLIEGPCEVMAQKVCETGRKMIFLQHNGNPVAGSHPHNLNDFLVFLNLQFLCVHHSGLCQFRRHQLCPGRVSLRQTALSKSHETIDIAAKLFLRHKGSYALSLYQYLLLHQ